MEQQIIKCQCSPGRNGRSCLNGPRETRALRQVCRPLQAILSLRFLGLDRSNACALCTGIRDGRSRDHDVFYVSTGWLPSRTERLRLFTSELALPPWSHVVKCTHAQEMMSDKSITVVNVASRDMAHGSACENVVLCVPSAASVLLLFSCSFVLCPWDHGIFIGQRSQIRGKMCCEIGDTQYALAQRSTHYVAPSVPGHLAFQESIMVALFDSYKSARPFVYVLMFSEVL